ncbi:MAG TPA: hypothetical protein VKT31_12185 [Solirubrobacteraceae bacterium]|nr:hypothetical protein [Solirubrobacteraceae bacterium]
MTAKEVDLVLNPLALGVTLAGLTLDILVPRPKPRVGAVPLVTGVADPRTARKVARAGR